MSIIEPRLFRDPESDAAFIAVGTRLQRRAMLDLSIDEEIVRGDLRGATLEEPLRSALVLVVEHELKQEEPLTEAELLATVRTRRLFGAGRYRRRLDALAGMNLVRREGRGLHATVAGISAVLRPSSLEGPRLPRELLRVLRQAELARQRR
ncbi:hypothetical protein GCM10009651_20350 [Microbacterium natoriense]|uniref:hypothetical protein n=1 Tax=Microbacterium TaxID=33882 RepID=UPI000CFA9065|nr:hypothetical protein [Microbacterium sp. MYb72]PRB11890.1 hypothetical protein CQ047_02205 [Microbacterium sp. MYb72]